MNSTEQVSKAIRETSQHHIGAALAPNRLNMNDSSTSSRVQEQQTEMTGEDDIE